MPLTVLQGIGTSCVRPILADQHIQAAEDGRQAFHPESVQVGRPRLVPIVRADCSGMSRDADDVVSPPYQLGAEI